MTRHLLKKVSLYVAENSLFTPGGTVVAAVSGGADSVALLDILVALGDYRLKVVVAHMNHLLRGTDADEDEEYVRTLARNYALPIVVKRVDVGEFANRERASLEEAGRICRYLFFDTVALDHGACAVALGHHKDDQAETVLLRLLRGAGGSGLSAMTAVTGGRFVRPLLDVTRPEIESYLEERGIAWRTDKSNEDAAFLRNRIRHQLIPYLAAYNPAIKERLAATAQALAADEEVLEAAVRAAFARHAEADRSGVTLFLEGVRGEPRGIRLRLYRQAIMQARGDLARISFRHLQTLDSLVFSSKPHLSLTLPNDLRANKSYQRLSFALRKEAAPPWTDGLALDGPGSYLLPGGELLAVGFVTTPSDLKTTAVTTAYFDADLAPFPWRVRNFRPGDRFAPLGMNGHKKVKELFMEEKIPLADRSRIPLLFSAETLLWVGGVRRSNAALLTAESKSIIRVDLTTS